MSAADFIHDPEVLPPGLGGFMGISMPSISIPRIDFDITKSPLYRELGNGVRDLVAGLPPEVSGMISVARPLVGGTGGAESLLRGMVCGDWTFVYKMAAFSTYVSSGALLGAAVGNLVDGIGKIVGMSPADTERMRKFVAKAMGQIVGIINGALMGICMNVYGVFESGGKALDALAHGRYGEFGHYAGAMNRYSLKLFVTVGAAVLAPVTGGASLVVCASYIAADSMGLVPGYFSTRDADQKWYQGLLQAALVMIPSLGEFGSALGYVPNAGVASAVSAMSAAFPSVAAALASAVSLAAKYALAAAAYLREMVAALPPMQAITGFMQSLGVSWERVVVAVIRKDYQSVLLDSCMGVGRLGGLPVDEASAFLAKAETEIRGLKDLRNIVSVMSRDLAARGARYLAPEMDETLRTAAAAGDYRSAARVLARTEGVPDLIARAQAAGVDPDQVERLLSGDRSVAIGMVQEGIADQASDVMVKADRIVRGVVGDEQFAALRQYGTTASEVALRVASARLAEAVAVDTMLDLKAFAAGGDAATVSDGTNTVPTPKENPAIYAAKWSTARTKTLAVVMREQIATFEQSRLVDITTSLVKSRDSLTAQYQIARASAVSAAKADTGSMAAALDQQYAQAVQSANARIETAQGWASTQQAGNTTAVASLLGGHRAAVMTKAASDIAVLDQMAERLALLAARTM